jgi:hypothetical protein
VGGNLLRLLADRHPEALGTLSVAANGGFAAVGGPGGDRHSAAEFIDSTIIHVLLQTMRSAAELESKFNVVLGTAPAVQRTLEVTGVIPLLGVVPTVERALAA